MLKFKIFYGLILSFYTIFYLIVYENESIRFTRANCSASGILTHKGYKCYIKSYNRNVTTLNVDVIFKKPIEKYYVIQYLILNQI